MKNNALDVAQALRVVSPVLGDIFCRLAALELRVEQGLGSDLECVRADVMDMTNRISELSDDVKFTTRRLGDLESESDTTSRRLWRLEEDL